VREAGQLGQRVPVEHRVWGVFDRRYVPALLVVIAVALLWAVVMPAVDEAISQDEIAAGTVTTLTHDVSFSPAPGWVYDGVPVGSQTGVTVFSSGVRFTIQSGRFKGSAEQLLAQVSSHEDDYKVTGDVRSLQTGQNVPGAATQIYGHDFSGALFAFTQDGVGVTAVADGPANLLGRQTRDVAGMIASIRFGGAG
jgi:hypothetical protein